MPRTGTGGKGCGRGWQPVTGLPLLLAAALVAAGCWGPPRAPAPPGAPPQAASQPSAPGASPGPRAPVAVTLPLSAPQGGVVVLRVAGAPGPVSVAAQDLPAPRPFAAGQGIQAAFVAVPPDARPGPRRLTVTWPGGRWQGELAVTRQSFPEDRIEVAAAEAARLEDPKAAAESRQVRALRARHGGTPPLWDSPFRLPVEGRLTTGYGEIRYVNGKWAGQHTGIDIAAPSGTPVRAAARGRVILAQPLVITGNTVVLDHGGNLFTLYGHLSAMTVREGDLVAGGQEIGQVGATGLATGPHLHFAVFVGNTPVNPDFLFGRPLPGHPE